MHEITLCQRALELIEQQAAKHGAKRVTGVWLKIGAFSCVETSSLAFCFDLVCRGSVAEGCKLHLEEQEAECWCETCQQYVTLLTQRVRRCPQCHGEDCGRRRFTDSADRNRPGVSDVYNMRLR